MFFFSHDEFTMSSCLKPASFSPVPSPQIQHGSKEYRDFWQFLHKYQAVERAKKRDRKEQKVLFPSDMEVRGEEAGASAVIRLQCNGEI